ncbi:MULTISPECIES: UDP-N-acetylmuramoyl-L-alanine--D-glutamate ligase [unclassified Meiothermus]|uniref:UDP-N-acetylmuramoyl-L-alanine--D-glutamate ligase n=1 Tax=unclassified Meiothermus TaxID=370471 RepID=UPI000D7BE260|nr:MULTISPECIES: UDP-N-acetylmuramoyl-L-alanine--D-glutamate ligase [unclassified Meiothermus]PZA07799.1 UDP-N-acetylmuramoyl-L-alanine--D-glutamate ligase [Meiothermus sp. Pnk-1]RYM38899.1 UDP-N-acetylmuramoyl-L-alanine--D-glutamate ligase [Meiothermus sp. PNK-Is4]
MRRAERLVFGLGRSGMGVLRFLARHRMEAHCFDENPKEAEYLAAAELGFAFNDDPKPGEYQQVIAAPGVPLDHPRLLRLRQGGAEVIGEAELAYRMVSTPIVGITGTAGKGTATVATAHFLRALGFKALEGGNLDPPLLDIIEEAEVAVAELSSFQLERVVHFRPRVAVLLNLGVDHLDRHHTLEAYHAAKLNLIRNLTPQDALVYNAEDRKIAQAVQASPAQKYPFHPGADPRQTNLRAAREAARAYARIAGRAVDELVLDEAETTAPRLPGRFDAFARKGQVVFIDDSIATRYDAVKAALQAAPAPIAWILGGRDKGAPTTGLERIVAERVRVVLAIGEDGPRMAQAFRECAEVVEIQAPTGEATLRKAVEEGLSRLSEGSILLAPMGTSFDQFKDYKERSQVFRRVAFELGATAWEGGRP